MLIVDINVSFAIADKPVEVASIAFPNPPAILQKDPKRVLDSPPPIVELSLKKFCIVVIELFFPATILDLLLPLMLFDVPKINTLSVFFSIVFCIPTATEESEDTLLFAFFIFFEVVTTPDNGPRIFKPSPSNLI